MEGSSDFSRLTEGCISHVLSLTSPRDVCRCSAVSSIFRSASQSDTVWERFLPSDYLEILARSSQRPAQFSSKKDLYFHLCTSILIDGGKMSFSLEKASGKKCYVLSARELLIIWGDIPRCWRWVFLPGSRFPEAAELLGVNWLEIHGKINTRMLSSKTNYVANIVIKFTYDAKGLDYPPTELLIHIRGQHISKHTAHLLEDECKRQHHANMVEKVQIFNQTHALRARPRTTFQDIRIPRARSDGWMEVEIGQFFIDNEDDGELEMSLMEVKGRNLKVGLIIQGIEIRPVE